MRVELMVQSSPGKRVTPSRRGAKGPETGKVECAWRYRRRIVRRNRPDALAPPRAIRPHPAPQYPGAAGPGQGPRPRGRESFSADGFSMWQAPLAEKDSRPPRANSDRCSSPGPKRISGKELGAPADPCQAGPPHALGEGLPTPPRRRPQVSPQLETFAPTSRAGNSSIITKTLCGGCIGLS